MGALTGPVFAASDTAGLGVSGQVVLRDGLAIPLGGAVLMLVPAVLVRLLRPPTRESLDGYVIGSLGAITYTAAGVLTRLAPQLTTGLVARGRGVGGLLVEAGIEGVAMPLTAAAAGGLVGAALWYSGRADPSRGGFRWTAPAAGGDGGVGRLRRDGARRCRPAAARSAISFAPGDCGAGDPGLTHLLACGVAA